MNSGVIKEDGRALSRNEIRRRLATFSTRMLRGDVATAEKLDVDGAVPVDVGKFDPATWGGLGHMPQRKPDDARKPAAVLVPLVEREHGFTVLLTQRAALLTAHAGQIAFPGGRVEPSDRDAEDAALRETWEEIGLASSHIEILGHLDPYVTVTSFEVTPVVGAVRPPFDLVLDPVEVAEAFEVPLAFFLDPKNHQRHSRVLPDGRARAYHALPFGERYIWGATAGMLLNLYEVLTASS